LLALGKEMPRAAPAGCGPGRCHDQVDAGATTPANVGTLLSLGGGNAAVKPEHGYRAGLGSAGDDGGLLARSRCIHAPVRLVASTLAPATAPVRRTRSSPWPCHTSGSVSAPSPGRSSDGDVPFGTVAGVGCLVACIARQAVVGLHPAIRATSRVDSGRPLRTLFWYTRWAASRPPSREAPVSGCCFTEAAPFPETLSGRSV
jgi:hypothetical protein